VAVTDTFRLFVEDNNGNSSYVVIAEFEILVGGVDITTDATATASSVFSSNTPNQAIDNNQNSHFAARVSSLPIFLQVVLLEPIDVALLDSYSIQGWYYSNVSAYAVKKFKFQYLDGADWFTLDSQIEQTDWDKYEVRNYPLAPVFYEISETISESLAASDFNVRAYDFSTGKLVAETLSSDNTYKLEFGVRNPAVFITCTADEGNAWLADTVYALDDKMFPNDPAITPYYYKCTQAGATGETQPALPAAPGETAEDNNVIWECVERLVQPITHGPLIPQPAV
jgi:hypothetical protein